MLSRGLLFALSAILISSSNAHVDETCEEELAREQAEDWKIHACRSCKMIDLDAIANCPPMGFHCDTDYPMRSSMLFPDSRGCAQLRCADTNATLAVGGRLVPRVTCSNQKWTVPTDIDAASGVCARKCGEGVCSTLPNEFFIANPDLLPFIVNPPDNEHPCAWGTCSDGAIALNSDKLSEGIPFENSVTFSCSGYRTWTLPENNRYAYVACKRKSCEPLDYDNGNSLCGTTSDDKFSCYAPVFTNDDSGNAEKIMKCDVANDLRISSKNEVVSPMCSLGQWTNKGIPLGKDTKIICLTCSIPRLDDNVGTEFPVMHGNQKTVTCPSHALLTLGLFRDPLRMPELARVDALFCSDDQVWEATLKWQTTDGEFAKFSSLSEAVNEGIFFRVFCLD